MEYKFRGPNLSYEFTPQDTGELDVTGQVLIFIPPNTGDTLELIQMVFKKVFIVE